MNSTLYMPLSLCCMPVVHACAALWCMPVYITMLHACIVGG